MKTAFIETENVSRFRKAVGVVEDLEKGQPGFMVAHGRAGRGKTFAAQNYYAEHGGIYIQVWQDWTQAAFLQALCFEVNGTRPRSSNTCKIRIVEDLNKEKRTIFVDEADRLHVRRLEDLRDIHEATGSPIVLIGEEELLGLVSSQRRLWSRVTQEVKFGSVSQTDIITFGLEAADLVIEPDASDLIKVRSGGDFRLVRNIVQDLEDMARARETNTITAKMVRALPKRIGR